MVSLVSLDPVFFSLILLPETSLIYHNLPPVLPPSPNRVRPIVNRSCRTGTYPHAVDQELRAHTSKISWAAFSSGDRLVV